VKQAAKESPSITKKKRKFIATLIKQSGKKKEPGSWGEDAMQRTRKINRTLYAGTGS